MKTAKEDANKSNMGSCNICNRGEVTSNSSNELIEIPDSLQKKKVSLSHFEMISLIGRGSFGKVFFVSHIELQRFYAMKVIPKHALRKAKRKSLSISERNILATIKSDFIVGLHFAFQNPLKLFLVQDFMQGGELAFHLRQQKKFPISVARFYAAEVILALEVLHQNGIIYRDLKPANILLEQSGHIRLADFNLSKLVEEESRAKTFCGSPEYIAPEVVKGHRQTHELDYWSLGVLIFEMVNGHSPFRARNPDVTYQKILKCRLNWKYELPHPVKDIVNQLLQITPEKRLRSNALKQHEFFEGIDWEAVTQRTAEPPIKPTIEHERDLSYFRREESDSDSADSRMEEPRSHYEGFSFIVH